MNPYQQACERLSLAAARYAQALGDAKQAIEKAAAEYEAAEAGLRQYEARPGVPLPQYREQVPA
ncbi:MAG TPA: hypothetical protein VKV80_05520 [Streptosporangiaceae bacterium]|jgi:uncharacterized protein YukE|nr:hypothetical protein [Streptosporangiaceae bacterium]